MVGENQDDLLKQPEVFSCAESLEGGEKGMRMAKMHNKRKTAVKGGQDGWGCRKNDRSSFQFVSAVHHYSEVNFPNEK